MVSQCFFRSNLGQRPKVFSIFWVFFLFLVVFTFFSMLFLRTSLTFRLTKGPLLGRFRSLKWDLSAVSSLHFGALKDPGCQFGEIRKQAKDQNTD